MNINITLKKQKIIILKIIILIFLYFLPIKSKASILTMLKPLGFIAAAIANNVTTVEVLIPNNISIHHYALRPLDIIKIKKADLLLTIGNSVEPTFLNKIFLKFKKKIFN